MGSLNQFLIVTFSQPPSSSNCFGYLHPHPLPPQSPFRCGWSPLQRLWCLFRQISFFICILVCLTDANLLIKISPKESGNSCLRFLCKVLKFTDIIAGNLFCSVSINVTVWKCWVSLKLYLPRNVVFQPVKPSNKIYIPWQHNENCQRFAKSPDGKQVFFFFSFQVPLSKQVQYYNRSGPWSSTTYNFDTQKVLSFRPVTFTYVIMMHRKR